MVRLDKYLTLALGISRSEAKNLLSECKVCVNGIVVKKGEIKIDEASDNVTCAGIRVSYEDKLYYMLNKPSGYVSATVDDINPTVISLFEANERKRLFPVGRLDIDTQGLIIITNDGQLSHHLTSPRHNIVKKYYARLSGIPDDEGIRKVEEGLDLGDFTAKAARLEIITSDVQNNESEVFVYISEGRYHQVKRMMSAIGCEVTFLKRTAIGDVCLDETLSPGEYRKLTETELSILRK